MNSHHCSQESPYFIGCSSSDFYCENGKCVLEQYTCDGVDDCGDYSDEDNCGII